MSRSVFVRLGYCLLLAAISGIASRATNALAAEDPRDAKIAAALNNPTTLRSIKVPLSDVVAYLSDLHDLAIQIDTKALEKAKVSADSPLTKDTTGISFAKALDEILRPLKLDYIIKDHMLTITTAEVAKEWRKAKEDKKP